MKPGRLRAPFSFAHAQRIKARAIRRTGELLKQIESAQGGDRGNQHTGGKKGGSSPLPTRTEAARQVGLSPDQQKQAIRVANVPAAEFEKAVESENPPTVTELAEKGKKKRDPAPLPADFPPPSTPSRASRRKLSLPSSKLPAKLPMRMPGCLA